MFSFLQKWFIDCCVHTVSHRSKRENSVHSGVGVEGRQSVLLHPCLYKLWKSRSWYESLTLALWGVEVTIFISYTMRPRLRGTKWLIQGHVACERQESRTKPRCPRPHLHTVPPREEYRKFWKSFMREAHIWLKGSREDGFLVFWVFF